MVTHSEKITPFTKYELCPGCGGTGKVGIVKRLCILCLGHGKLPVGRSDGEGWEKR